MVVTAGVAAMLLVIVDLGAGVFVAVGFVGLVDELRRNQPHPALGAAFRRVAHDVGMHRAGICGGNGDQFHAAVRASALVGGDNFGVHRAGVGDSDGDG